MEEKKRERGEGKGVVSRDEVSFLFSLPRFVLIFSKEEYYQPQGKDYLTTNSPKNLMLAVKMETNKKKLSKPDLFRTVEGVVRSARTGDSPRFGSTSSKKAGNTRGCEGLLSTG